MKTEKDAVMTASRPVVQAVSTMKLPQKGKINVHVADRPAPTKGSKTKHEKVKVKPLPTPEELKERRFKNFMRTGLDPFGYALYEAGDGEIKISDLDPVPKSKRTRRLFETVDKKYLAAEKKEKINEQLVCDLFFDGKPMEYLPDAKHKRILSLYKNGVTVADIAKRLGIREDTVFFHLAECTQVPFCALVAEAKMLLGGKRQNPRLYAEGFKEMFEIYSVALRMERIKVFEVQRKVEKKRTGTKK